MTSTLTPLKIPGFRHLLGTYSFNEIGNWLGEIALTVLVFQQTGSPLAATALFLGMQFVPAFFVPALVARTELLGFKNALVLLYLLEGVALGAQTLLAANFLLTVVILLALVDGALGLAARSLTRGAAASITQPRDQLREGNALINFGFAGAGAIGPALAGVVVALLGARGALALDAASFLVVAVVLVLARSLPASRHEKTARWWQRLRDAAKYVRDEPGLGLLIGGQAVAYLFFSAVLPVEIIYATDALGVGSSGYGALLAAWGTGMIAGSILFAAARKAPIATLIIGGTILTGLSYGGMALAQTLTLACTAAVVGGIGNGVQWVSMLSAIQSLTQHSFQARVMGFLEALVSITVGIGFMLGGLVTELVSVRTTFLVAAIGAAVVGALLGPAIRRIGASAALSDRDAIRGYPAPAPAPSEL